MEEHARYDQSLYFQTVPVFSDFALRIVALAQLAHENRAIGTRLVSDTFSAGEHLVIAQGFSLRTVFPVLGRACPTLSTEEPSYTGINQRHLEISKILRKICLDDFKDSESRDVILVAGDADVTQNALEYVTHFGIPNFFFHFTMAYATLRALGIEVGKAQFDGIHEYSPGFSFQDQ